MPDISDAAVKKATGKTWPQWFKILDAAGGKKMDHKGIVVVLSDGHDLGPWWRQMVTVGYERARGLRDKNQTVTGYSHNITKTIAAGPATLFKARTGAKRRAAWLNGASEFTITTSTPNKSIRIKWIADDSRVAVSFYPKGENKTQVNVEHSKLATKSAGEKARKFWAARLGDLQKLVEKS